MPEANQEQSPSSDIIDTQPMNPDLQECPDHPNDACNCLAAAIVEQPSTCPPSEPEDSASPFSYSLTASPSIEPALTVNDSDSSGVLAQIAFRLSLHQEEALLLSGDHMFWGCCENYDYRTSLRSPRLWLFQGVLAALCSACFGVPACLGTPPIAVGVPCGTCLFGIPAMFYSSYQAPNLWNLSITFNHIDWSAEDELEKLRNFLKQLSNTAIYQLTSFSVIESQTLFSFQVSLPASVTDQTAALTFLGLSGFNAKIVVTRQEHSEKQEIYQYETSL